MLAFLPLAAGCATVGGARPWAEQATLKPGKRTFTSVVVSNAKAPQTWAPLALAALFQVDHLDARASTWASDHTPVFGTQAHADNASTELANAVTVVAGATILLVPSGTEPQPWVVNKAKGGLLDVAAIGFVQGTAAAVKSAAGRTRPNGKDDRSFPSGHSTRSSAAAVLAQRNVRAAFGPSPATTAFGLGTFALAAGSAWARVEAGAHYPADVLAGFALGHFVTAVINDAFVTPAAPVALDVSIVPGRGGAVAISWHP